MFAHYLNIKHNRAKVKQRCVAFSGAAFTLWSSFFYANHVDVLVFCIIAEMAGAFTSFKWPPQQKLIRKKEKNADKLKIYL